MNDNADVIRLSPIGLFAIIGGAIAFVASGAFVALVWVAIGAGIGAAFGWVIRRWAGDLRTLRNVVDLRDRATKNELYAQAQRLDIPGRSTMDRDELARAVAEHQTPAS